MARRSSKSYASPESRETTWLLALLVLAVVLPTAGFLWFMTKALRNERAVMREQQSELHDVHLANGKRNVERALKRFATANLAVLEQSGLRDEQRAIRMQKRGLADGLICLGADGVPTYPILPESSDDVLLEEADEKALTLIESWDVESGYEDVLSEFKKQQCQGGRDYKGRYIYPNLLLGRLSAQPVGERSEMARELAVSVAKPPHPWPSSQRLYLASALRAQGYEVEIPGESGLLLGLRALEQPLRLGRAGLLEPAPGVDGVWRLLTENRRYLLLFQEATLRETLAKAAEKGQSESSLQFSVAPISESELPSVSLGEIAAQWNLILHSDSASPTEDAKQKRAFTLALGCMLVAVVGVIATFAVRRFYAQSKLTQLRNDFLSTISHELKTPLASTRMLVDTLVDGKVADDPEKTRSYLEVIGAREHAIESFGGEFPNVFAT